jgi:hypothetical protein
MGARRGLVKLVALAVVIVLPILGLSGMASATKKGSPPWCAKHPAKAASVASCQSASSGSGSGGPGDPPAITVQVDPSPLVETGQSEVYAIIQVEASPSLAGDPITISSTQLQASCGGTINFLGTINSGSDTIVAFLDDDGNATVWVQGVGCAPGPSVIEASLTVAPYDTALATLVVDPPVVTPSGVFGYPTTSGTVTTGVVETGDTTLAQSDILAVFYVETDPVYAEQTVEISSAQLESRCAAGWVWIPGNQAAGGSGETVAPTATAILDDDGNAVITFLGGECAAGPSEVIADVLAGSHPTYTTTFTIDAPQPTI